MKLLHLPAESFIEDQLRAQSLAKDHFVCTSAYGDGGPWYIPAKEEYPPTPATKSASPSANRKSTTC